MEMVRLATIESDNFKYGINAFTNSGHYFLLTPCCGMCFCELLDVCWMFLIIEGSLLTSIFFLNIYR